MKKRQVIIPLIVFFVLFLFGIPLIHVLSDRSAIITLDPSTTYQTIIGWEAVAQAGQRDCPAFQSYKDELFAAAVNDLGINRLRVAIRPMGGDSLKFNLSGLDFDIENVVLPMRQLVQAKGEHLFVNINFLGPSGFTSQPDMSAYAEQVLETYNHIKEKYGFYPDAWEIALEPGVVSPGWGGRQIDDALIRTDKLLIENGIPDPYLIAPSSPCGPEKALTAFDEMLKANNGALPTGLDEFAYHRYCQTNDQELEQIGSLRTQYGIKTAMLEHGGADYKELHADLALANVSAWQQFALAYCTKDDGYQYYPIQGDTFSLGERTKFLRQYFKFIHQGAVRIQSSSDAPGFDPLAFINPKEDYVVVVKANQGGSFVIQGLPAGSYGIKYTTVRKFDIDLPDVVLTAGQDLTADIPDEGVITIFARSEADVSAAPTATIAAQSQPTGTPTMVIAPTLEEAPLSMPKALRSSPFSKPKARNMPGEGGYNRPDLMVEASAVCIHKSIRNLKRY